MPGRPAPAATAAALVVTAASTDRIARRRARRAQAEMREQHRQQLARLPTAEEAARSAIVDVLEHRPEAVLRAVATPITDRIHARLEDGDVAHVESLLAGENAHLYATCDPATRRRIALNFAAAYGLEPVLARAGFSSSMPPEAVHTMARGDIAAGGDLYLADLIFDALDHAGITVPENGTVLDFGVSSGRVLRTVAAGRPDLECLGCDPNEGAIAWASENLPMARFLVSPQRPPLALPDGSVDLVYAVSIWSHFAEAPAIGWLAEMHRILAPGQALVLTTHGVDCLTTQLRRRQISPETAAAAAEAVLQGRHHFVDVFGADGDWGVKDEGWGNAYFATDWLLRQTGDDWALSLVWPGALDQVQDVIVLRRR